MNDLVSVIIPLFNRVQLIGQTLASVHNQVCKNYSIEIIIVDDGSTDGGADWVEKHYPEVKLFRQANLGAPAARNYGLRESKGNYILFLDSDDILSEDFFTIKIKWLNEHHSCGMVYGPWEHFTEVNREFELLPRHTNYPLQTKLNNAFHLEKLLSGWYIIPHAILWRKKVLIELGGYKEGLPLNQDVDLMFRALANGHIIGSVDSPIALYREHDGDRVGKFNDAGSLQAILTLRIEFIALLKEKGFYLPELRLALAKYLLGMYQYSLHHDSKLSEKFWDIYLSLNAKVAPNGGLAYRLLICIFGWKKAIRFKKSFF